jgi:hypothetical protein
VFRTYWNSNETELTTRWFFAVPNSRKGRVSHQLPATVRDGEPHNVGSGLYVAADAVEVRGHHLVSRRVTEENAHLRVHDVHM